MSPFERRSPKETESLGHAGTSTRRDTHGSTLHQCLVLLQQEGSDWPSSRLASSPSFCQTLADELICCPPRASAIYRYETEGGDPANAGLQHARVFLEPIKEKYPVSFTPNLSLTPAERDSDVLRRWTGTSDLHYCPQWISYSDLWTLAGVVAVKEMGGPDIPWKAGRTDFDSEDFVSVARRQF